MPLQIAVPLGVTLAGVTMIQLDPVAGIDFDRWPIWALFSLIIILWLKDPATTMAAGFFKNKAELDNDKTEHQQEIEQVKLEAELQARATQQLTVYAAQEQATETLRESNMRLWQLIDGDLKTIKADVRSLSIKVESIGDQANINAHALQDLQRLKQPQAKKTKGGIFKRS